MLTAFISRELRPDSPFAQLLTAAGWTVYGQSLLLLESLPIKVLPEADWWFFSSGNAVRYLFAQTAFQFPKKLAALGPATAAVLQAATGEAPDFTGDGDPAATAAAFAALAAGQRVLFPGAERSKQSVKNYLGGRVTGFHLPVYRNVPTATPPDWRSAAVLAFTSPLNVEAYFSKWPLVVGQRVLAIGPTTAEALRACGVEAVEVAVAPSEIALARLALNS